MFVFDERVQISQSNVLALVRDFLYQDPLPDWYIKEALSEEHLADSKGSHWVDFFAWDEVSGLEYAVKHGRITLAEGTTIETLTSSPKGNNNKEKVFTIVGTRLENRELTNEWGTFTVPMVTDKNVAVALVRVLPITENTCRIRIVLAEFDSPVMRHIENMAYYILERTESKERAENWQCKQTSPNEPTAIQAAASAAPASQEKTAANVEINAEDALKERKTRKTEEQKRVEQQIEQLWRDAKTDAQIGMAVGLSADRVKQIRYELNLKERTRKKKTT